MVQIRKESDTEQASLLIFLRRFRIRTESATCRSHRPKSLGEQMTERDKAAVSVVGIGASAGGLEALSAFVKAIPDRSGLAYVIVQHLAPDHPSIMDQLLQSHTSIPVRKIEEGMAIKPDTIFVIPAGPSLTIEDGTLHLHDRDPDVHLRTPIDEFLTSLAKDCGSSAFAVILSGTGSDGTLGVRAVKAAGGFAIVQQSDSARFPGMPDSAAATGMVDFVLKPDAIPDRLIDIVQHRYELENASGSHDLWQDIENSLGDIMAIIDREDGHDFTDYKKGTLIRRIERRLALLRINSVEQFVAQLENDEDERSRLLQHFPDRRDTFLPRRRSFRPPATGHRPSSAKSRSEPVSRMGAGLFYRRGSLFDCNAVRRSDDGREGRSAVPDFRHRYRCCRAASRTERSVFEKPSRRPVGRTTEPVSRRRIWRLPDQPGAAGAMRLCTA